MININGIVVVPYPSSILNKFDFSKFIREQNEYNTV